MFKLLMDLFFDITGAIFFILKIVVVGVGKVFTFLVNAIISSASNDTPQEYIETGIRPSRIDQTSCMYDDIFISMNDD